MTKSQQNIDSDLALYEKLFKEHYQSLCAYSAKIINDPIQAEELVQDLFYNLWDKRNKLIFNTNTKAYLIKALKNNSLAYLKKINKNIEISDHQLAVVTGESTDDKVINEEINSIINDTLNSLPSNWKQIFTLIRFEGLKYREVAERLSISVKTVEKAMGRALKLMKTNLSEYMGILVILVLINFLR